MGEEVSYLVPSVCILALLVGLYSFINPTAYANTNRTYAVEDSNVETVDAESSLSLSINGNPNEVTPVTVDEVAYRSNTFTVSANKYRNYIVTLSAMNGSGAELHGRNNPYATINGVGENVLPTNFASNTWGYNFTANNTDIGDIASASLTYSTPPAYNAPQRLITNWVDGENVVDTHKITFAAKIGADSPKDHYESSLILSVVGEPEGVVFGNITTMQAMTSTICGNAKENDTVQLTDTRDNRKYWVTKLKDGNCWMTQNLGLRLTTTGLSSKDTNIDKDWTSADNTITSLASGTYFTNKSYWTAESYWHDATQTMYYSWQAAVAGTGTSSLSNIIDSSIYPKGWTLPGGEFSELYKAVNSPSEFIAEPYNFSPTGYAWGSGIQSTDGGYWWTKVLTQGGSTYRARALAVKQNSVDAQYGMYTFYGLPVRCLAE